MSVQEGDIMKTVKHELFTQRTLIDYNVTHVVIPRNRKLLDSCHGFRRPAEAVHVVMKLVSTFNKSHIIFI